MKPLTHIEGWACPVPLANIDTDQLIPARFMKISRSQGYGDYLLYDLRRDEDGNIKSDWPLNQDDGRRAEVLVARKNFGGGSSREAAVYALVDHGFRCIIAPSFGDIFASNAVNNGLLPATVTEDVAEQLLLALGGVCRRVEIDLEKQEIRCSDRSFGFQIKPNWKMKLLNGWDDIALTLSLQAEIREFRSQRRTQLPWLFPSSVRR
jgi:3-isopropylmalate/(R)-2-methylmalate dehydratase small subunit